MPVSIIITFVFASVLLSFFIFRFLLQKRNQTGTLKDIKKTKNEVSDLDKNKFLKTESALLPEAPQELSLKKTNYAIWGKIKSLLQSDTTKTLESHWEQIEEVLYSADLGTKTVQDILSELKKDSNIKNLEDLNKFLFNFLTQKMGEVQKFYEDKSFLDRFYGNGATQTTRVIMIVGVNGAGKTTSIGKLAAKLAQSGQKVLIAAGDTFRAAAANQLKVWGERAQVEIFSPPGVTDPGAVAFDAVKKAQAGQFNFLILDTAGRLHTQTHLMEELKKVKRVIQKIDSSLPHEIWLVADANTGQNAMIQAREFNSALNLTGVILTKLDGSAKGGVAIGIVNEIKVPILFVGVGEKSQDIELFQVKRYIQDILLH